MTADVVAFAPRPKQEPELQFVEIRLDTETCGLQLSVVDEAGNTFVLEYSLAKVPEGFDLTRLVTAWDNWRGSTAAAS
jgi:hypothetical protein